MSCESGDEAFDNISKKYVKLKRVSPVQEYRPVPAILPFSDELDLFEVARNLMSNFSSLNRRNPGKRRGTNSRGTPSKRGRKTLQSELAQLIGYQDSLSSSATSSRGRKNGKNARASSSCSTAISSPPTRNRGGKTSSRSVNASTRDSSPSKKQTTQQRGRGRGRKSTANTRHASVGNILQSSANNLSSNPQPMLRRSPRMNLRSNVSATQSYYNIPTYSVGNTDEYYDELEAVPLFSSKPIENNDIIEINDSITENNVSFNNLNNDVIIIDEEDGNEVLSVRVEWKCFDIVKFNICKHQKIKEIFDHFAEKENVEMDKLALFYNDQILTPDDTPHSIGYCIAKCIEGGVVSSSINTEFLKETPPKNSGIRIKFQCQKFKRPFETHIQKNEKLSQAMYKCAEHFELPLKSLKFEFDGDVVTGTETAESLDIEDEACIDVKIKT